MYQLFQGDQLDYREDSTLVGILKWLKNGGESIWGKFPIIYGTLLLYISLLNLVCVWNIVWAFHIFTKPSDIQYDGMKILRFNDTLLINFCKSLQNLGEESVGELLMGEHTWYLSFFLHEQNFWRIKFTPKKRINYDKIHSKLPIFCVITAKYTVNCQFFALNL